MDSIKELYKGTVSIKERRSIELNYIEGISAFDSDYVKLITKWGNIFIYGKGMNIVSLDKENGIITVEGEIDEVGFDTKKAKKGGGLFN